MMADEVINKISHMESKLDSKQEEVQAELKANREELQANKAELHANAREIAEMKEAMHASVQLIMSKISALSTQHQHAPAIFEGADRRKLQKEQKGMKQGQIAVRHRQIAYFDMVGETSYSVSCFDIFINRSMRCGQ